MFSPGVVDFFPGPTQKRAPGWLGFIGDDELPSYIGIIINHYKDDTLW